MTFNNFVNLIKENMEKRLCEEAVCKIDRVLKNNGLELIGLTVVSKDINISPTIYLNKLYDEYETQGMSIEEIIEEIFNTYEKTKMKASFDLKKFMDYSQIADRIVFKLVNTDKNSELLKDLPHVDICDLSIIFQCLINEELIGDASITIHNAHAALWGVDTNELYRQALINTPQLRKCEVINMRDILLELNPNPNEDFEELIDELPLSIPMFVLTNRSRINGASCVCYPKVLETFSESVKSDLYIIPSSIHEVILIPCMGNEDTKDMLEMIREVNMTQLTREEILSDSLYLYKRNNHKLQIVV